MSAPRKLPDKSTLRQMRSQGMRLKDIAAQYDTTESAVWNALDRAGFTPMRQETYRDLMPWDVDPKHRSTAITQRFRSMMRLKRGVELNPTEQHLLDTWLLAIQQANVVVAYHVDAPPNDASRLGGFFYTERYPEDEWIVRVPEGSDWKPPATGWEPPSFREPGELVGADPASSHRHLVVSS